MFGDIDKLDEMKDKLNEVSPSFCMAKWMHSTLHLMTGRTHSCYLPPTHHIPLEEVKANPSALHNTCYKKSMRKKMKEGERPDECSICWGVEDLPGKHYSDRHYRGVDSWTMPHFEKVKDMNWDEDVNPTYLEVSWSAACNFKCMYCSPTISTAWMKEIKKHGPYMLSENDHQNIEWLERENSVPRDDRDNPYIKAYWEWWPDLVKDLEFFRVTGGEPLMSHHTFKLLEWLYENPQPHLELSINSNLGVTPKQFDKFMNLIKPVMLENKIKTHLLHTSLDTWGPQAEYIRHGLDLKVFENYLDRYMTEIPNASVAFMCTLNVLSMPSFIDFLKWILSIRSKYNNMDRQVLLDIPHLQSPEMFTVKILTPDFYPQFEKAISFMQAHESENFGFKKAEIQKMERILSWIKDFKDKKLLTQYRRDFYLFIKEHDARRGTDFVKTFPEMEGFYRLCQSLAGDFPNPFKGLLNAFKKKTPSKSSSSPN